MLRMAMVIVTIRSSSLNFMSVILGCGGMFVNGIKKALQLQSLLSSSTAQPVSFSSRLRSTLQLQFRMVGD